MKTLHTLLLASLCIVVTAMAAAAQPSHAIAMHGEPALGADFSHLPYANPDAPKGGTINYAVQGTFDSVNPYIVQGSGARGVVDLVFGNLVFDSLMMRSYDEPFTLYPLIAKTVETDEERSFVEFQLDRRARFSDGEPVTPQDVIFTLELLRDKGLPRYRTTIDKIERIEMAAPNGVRLVFKEPDRELPLILGLMPVLPKHAIDAETFDRSTLKPMIGSGPYRIEMVRPGELITFRRNEDYWARDISSKRGFDNYDEIRINYFRDENTLFEAFKKGLIDIHIENSASRWSSEYDFPAVTSGAVVKESFRSGLPSGMHGFVLNTRRPVFQNRKLRRALAGLFDFEWANRNLFSGVYTRTKSYWDGSELSSHGRPASDKEREFLADFPDAVAPSIMAGEWSPPSSDGSGRDRAFLRHGYEALKHAGYQMEEGRMVDANGRPLSFEIMLKAKSGEELALAWQRTLSRLGIQTTLRSADAAQYQQRLITFDYDVILYTYPSSLSPGVEQVGRWGSVARDANGSWNFAGVAEPAVDAMIDALLNARSRADFVEAVRAYDRVLLSGAWVVPLYHRDEQWLARWSRIAHPDVTPLYGYQLTTWWRSPG
ncbi:extracellular solute-binding protein [Mesorhizobium xinjiangense]|uniref:extracellular solute-binding protein n=1 Tax=Mesorhizobium xinjiangense TaxID=2678685 RepID=UPI0012EE18DB|nr:extracellular solute-binding protein [Mesorhizobium xinjiangense]